MQPQCVKKLLTAKKKFKIDERNWSEVTAKAPQKVNGFEVYSCTKYIVPLHTLKFFDDKVAVDWIGWVFCMQMFYIVLQKVRSLQYYFTLLNSNLYELFLWQEWSARDNMIFFLSNIQLKFTNNKWNYKCLIQLFLFIHLNQNWLMLIPEKKTTILIPG